MSKKLLNKPGYTVEIVHERDWKVIVKWEDIEQYYYLFDTEEQAIQKYNSIN